jgi:hypothetical protein
MGKLMLDLFSYAAGWNNDPQWYIDNGGFNCGIINMPGRRLDFYRKQGGPYLQKQIKVSSYSISLDATFQPHLYRIGNQSYSDPFCLIVV